MNIVDALFILGVTCLVVAYFEHYRRAQIERIEKTGQWYHKMHKYHFNFTTQRFELTKEQLEALPFKVVCDNEFWKLCGSIEYNPHTLYEHLVKLKENEAGHDLQFRYIYQK